MWVLTTAMWSVARTAIGPDCNRYDLASAESAI